MARAPCGLLRPGSSRGGNFARRGPPELWALAGPRISLGRSPGSFVQLQNDRLGQAGDGAGRGVGTAGAGQGPQALRSRHHCCGEGGAVMMRRMPVLIVLVCLPFVAADPARAAAQPSPPSLLVKYPELVVVNGKVVTGDDSSSVHQ